MRTIIGMKGEVIAVRILPMTHIKNLCLLTFYCISAAIYSGHINAATKFCPNHANTEYEIAYCKIKESQFKRFLPAEPDFQKNTPMVQYLLIKNYAAKLDLKLPKPDKLKSPEPKPPSARKNQATAVKPKVKKPAIQHQDFPILSQCRIKTGTIQCPGNVRFNLQSNLPGQAISTDSLSNNNLLALADYSRNIENVQEVQGFLSSQYRVYLDKMNEVGLIETALSWDKFTQIFFVTQRNNMSFSHRFETMFSMLKKDRREGLFVATNTQRNFPLESCQYLDKAHIICFSNEKTGYFVRQN